MQLLRNLFIFFTSLVALLGFCCFVIGCWAATGPTFEKDVKEIGIDIKDVDHHLKTGGVVILLVGLATMLTGLIGCFGAWKNKSALLTAFALLLIIPLILSFASLIIISMSPKYASGIIDDLLEADSFKNMLKNSTEWHTVDTFQQKHSCCFRNSGNERCSLPTTVPTAPTAPTTDPCEPKVKQIVKETIRKYLPVAIAFNVFHILFLIGGIGSACYLAKRGKDFA